MSAAVLIAKAAALLLTDENARRAVGWAVAAVLAPAIVLVALLCALGTGAAAHNTSAVELCFQSGELPDDLPEAYRVRVQETRDCFALLDEAVGTINGQAENSEGLDAVRVKAVFYALCFGGEAPAPEAVRRFADCFVVYEERTRTVVAGDGVETEETYPVAVPIRDLDTVWETVGRVMGAEASEEQKSNAEYIYNLIRYGRTEAEAAPPATGAEDFRSPLGADWRDRITSDFGYRICPYHGRELHAGLDMAAPSGAPIRAALAGTVVTSAFHSSLGNYTVIDHGNGMTTGYAHQSRRLVAVGDTVKAGEVIGLVGSTGDSTGSHLHLEVRVDGQLQDPKIYLP